MKTLIVTDLHIGEFTHGFIDPETGHNSRLIDVYRRFNKIRKYCIKNNIDTIVIPGDIYDLKTPKNLIRKTFAQIVKKTIQKKLKLIIMIGNHDISSSTGHALAEMEELSGIIDGLTIISTPKVMRLGDVDFMFLPWNPFNTREDNHNELLELSKQIKRKSVLIGHFATNKNTYGITDDEEILDFDYVKSLNFNAVFLGHLHKHCQLDKNMWHIGSFTRTSFNEEDEVKQVVEFDNDNCTYEFIEFDDRKFKTFTYQDNFEQFEYEIENTDLSELVTRIQIKIKENDLKYEKIDQLINFVKENSWKYVGTIKDIVKVENSSFTMTEKTTPKDAFKIYLEENTEFFGDLKTECYQEGLKILESLKG